MIKPRSIGRACALRACIEGAKFYIVIACRKAEPKPTFQFSTRWGGGSGTATSAVAITSLDSGQRRACVTCLQLIMTIDMFISVSSSTASKPCNVRLNLPTAFGHMITY